MGRDRAHEHVLVSVEAGSSVREELAVYAEGDGRYRLRFAPALTVGLATGDMFEIDSETLRPTVLERSGNLTVWLFPRGAVAEAHLVAEEAEAIGGTFEGAAKGDVFIFTFPITATFPAVESIFDGFLGEHPRSEWLFGNVYDDDGVTPLGWWET